ncbi:hypothetical protein I548_0626 [Mycobacterium intracellulare]|nr:hypothetical protein I548_0626 [Mycobacterium intracellulare]
MAGGARRVEQGGHVGAAELLADVRRPFGQRGIRRQIEPRTRVGQDEVDLRLSGARIDRHRNAAGHHDAPEREHPVDPRGVPHRDPVAPLDAFRAQPTSHPRGAVPELSVRQPAAAQLDQRLAARTGVDVFGEHVQQGGGQLVVARDAVAAAGHADRRERVVVARDFDHWRHTRSLLSGVLS